MREIKYDYWIKEGTMKFGENTNNWKFVCPSCGMISQSSDWKNEAQIAFSCVGRQAQDPGEIFSKTQPCNYAGGGLFRLNPVHVKLENGNIRETFEFAEDDDEGNSVQS